MKTISVFMGLFLCHSATMAQVYYGLFEEGLPNNNTRLASMEAELGKKPGVVLSFMSAGNNVDVTGSNNLISKGITPIITLEPGWTYTSVINGDHDAYWKTVAGQLKQIKGAVFIRYAHEMNGNWYSWDGFHNGASAAAAADYITAWRHVYTIIKTQEGAHNVLWNWCVNGGSFPTDSWNNHMNYYPGSDYVDWIGFDSYDKPYNYTPTRYKSVDDIFGTVYSILTKAVPDKPLLVGEFASENYGQEADPHKLDFFSQGGNLFEKYPRIHAFSYFNVAKNNSGRWNNYMINNPVECLPVFKANWIDPVNVISGNKGLDSVHLYKPIPSTGSLRIEAEHYFDQSGIKNQANPAGGLNVANTTSGDYMDYLVKVDTTGTYICTLRVASTVTTGKILIKNQAGLTLGSYSQLTSTGGWQTWENHSISLQLTAGKQKLRIEYGGDGLNLDWFELVKDSGNPTPVSKIAFPRKETGGSLYSVQGRLLQSIPSQTPGVYRRQ